MFWGMVNIRMQGRVENLESQIGNVEQGIGHLDHEFNDNELSCKCSSK